MRGKADMSMKKRIEARLQTSLAPILLEVLDESHQHAGHSGAREGGETHFRVNIVSASFVGKSRVARHREINALLAAEFADGIHALALRTLAPGET
jgi:BolA protein